MSGYRVIVTSDTHGRLHALHKIVTDRMEEAACFIHLGDGWKEIEEIREIYPKVKLYSVCGNCDFGCHTPAVGQIDIGGKSIYYTHGHLQNVKYGLDSLKQTARDCGADILLYGHTHQSRTEYDDGLYVMNPGSPVQPRDFKSSYGVIDICPAGIVLNIVSF